VFVFGLFGHVYTTTGCFDRFVKTLTGLSKHWMTSTSRGSSKIEPISWREMSLDLNGF